MIPKVIHYCWFGENSLPDSARKCIESWKMYCPDYKIIEWNESNFDLHCCKYVEGAAQAKKWAFVSDYARFWILYNYGGLYFDTDVELVCQIDDLIEKGPFLGCEQDKDGYGRFVAPGLGMAAEPGMKFYKKMIDFYMCQEFYKNDGTINDVTIVVYTTNLLEQHGYIHEEGKIKEVCGMRIYPQDYFCPMNYYTGIITKTDNTRSIHHYSMSWKNEHQRKLKHIERRLRRCFGNKIGWFIYRIIYALFGKKN